MQIPSALNMELLPYFLLLTHTKYELNNSIIISSRIVFYIIILLELSFALHYEHWNNVQLQKHLYFLSTVSLILNMQIKNIPLSSSGLKYAENMLVEIKFSSWEAIQFINTVLD